MDSDLLADLDDLGEDLSSDSQDSEESPHVSDGHRALLESVKGVDDVSSLTKILNSSALTQLIEVIYNTPFPFLYLKL
jgi:hypothetical protein